MKNTTVRLCALSLLLVALLASGSMVQATEQEPASPHKLYLPIVSRPLPSGWIGPGGGRILCLAVDPQNPANLYAGTVDAGIFKSTDGGATWFESNQGLGAGGLFIQSLAIDPGHPSNLYAGVYKDGLYKSVDAGLTWTRSNSGIQASPVIYVIAVDPKNSNNVYIGTRGIAVDSASPDGKDWNGKLYVSNNAGASWSVKLEDIGGSDWGDWIYSIAIVPGAPNEVLATSHEHGAFISTDTGKHWRSISDGLAKQSGRSIAVDPQTTPPNTTAYLGLWHGGIYKTTNDGKDWSLTGSGYNLNNTYVYPGSLVVDPLQTSTLYFGDSDGGVYKTSNGGSSWSLIGLSGNPIYAIAVHPKTKQVVFSGTQTDGLYQSVDGGKNWAHLQTGLHAEQATGLLVNPANPQKMYASTNGSGVFSSGDHGETWSDFNTNLADKVINGLVARPGSPNLLYALTGSHGLYMIDTTAGTGWVKTGANLPDAPAAPGGAGPSSGAGSPFTRHDPLPELFPDLAADQQPAGANAAGALLTNDSLLAMQFAPANPNYAYLGTNSNGLYRSTNGAASWSQFNFSGHSVTTLAVDPQNPAALYAVPDSGATVWYYDGAQWSSSTVGASVYALSFSQFEAGTVYAGTSSGVFRRTGGGGTWTRLGLGGLSVTAVAGHPGIPGRIYAGTTSGVYISTDNGVTWIPGPTALAGLTIQSIGFDPVQGSDPIHVYYATTTHDIYRDPG